MICEIKPDGTVVWGDKVTAQWVGNGSILLSDEVSQAIIAPNTIIIDRKGIIDSDLYQSALEYFPKLTDTNETMWVWDEKTNSYISKYDVAYVETGASSASWDNTTLSTHGIVAVLTSLFPMIDKIIEFPCSCGSKVPEYKDTIHDIIIHLNDKHKWSREKIADWLDSLDVDLTLASISQGD